MWHRQARGGEKEKWGAGAGGSERDFPLLQGDRGGSTQGTGVGRPVGAFPSLLRFLARGVPGPSLPAHSNSCLGFPLLEAKTCFSEGSRDFPGLGRRLLLSAQFVPQQLEAVLPLGMALIKEPPPSADGADERPGPVQCVLTLGGGLGLTVLSAAPCFPGRVGPAKVLPGCSPRLGALSCPTGWKCCHLV